MSPARRNRNQTVHRGLAYLKANHPQLNAEICFGSGRICFGESGTSTLVKVSYESVPTYYATLRTHNVDKDKLNDAISGGRSVVLKTGTCQLQLLRWGHFKSFEDYS